jgi:hypothetical protein
LYSHININSASVSLQHSLAKLTHWANDWQLTINVSKCIVLSICSKHDLTQLDYCINGIPVPQQNCIADLGVTITSDLSFDAHVNNIVSKARQRLSTLFRGFLTRNVNIMRRAFIAYVRPVLEYNSIVWNPSFIYLIDLLESMQRSFMKRLPSISSRTYPERLALLDLKPLELRRLRADLIYCFKIFNNLTPFDANEVFLIYTPIASSRSNSPYLLKLAKASNKELSVLFFQCVKLGMYCQYHYVH